MKYVETNHANERITFVIHMQACEKGVLKQTRTGATAAHEGESPLYGSALAHPFRQSHIIEDVDTLSQRTLCIKKEGIQQWER